MPESQQREHNGSGSQQMRQTLEHERKQAESLAQELSRQSIRQWQKTIEGLVAFPAAIAVSLAATTLYGVGFLARGFEVFGAQAEQARISLTEERGEGRLREGELRPGAELQSPTMPRA
jgi:hypothetical protein